MKLNAITSGIINFLNLNARTDPDECVITVTGKSHGPVTVRLTPSTTMEMRFASVPEPHTTWTWESDPPISPELPQFREAVVIASMVDQRSKDYVKCMVKTCHIGVLPENTLCNPHWGAISGTTEAAALKMSASESNINAALALISDKTSRREAELALELERTSFNEEVMAAREDAYFDTLFGAQRGEDEDSNSCSDKA